MPEQGEIAEQLAIHVERWTQGFIKKRPHLREHYEDLLGVAYVRMMEVLEKLGPDALEDKFDGKFDKLSTYIRLSTRTAFSDFFRRNKIISSPHTRKPIPCEQLGRDPIGPDGVPTMPESEVMETLWECAKDERDRDILRDRVLQGGPISGTIQRTGYARNTITKRLRQMMDRYERMTE